MTTPAPLTAALDALEQALDAGHHATQRWVDHQRTTHAQYRRQIHWLAASTGVVDVDTGWEPDPPSAHAQLAAQAIGHALQQAGAQIMDGAIALHHAIAALPVFASGLRAPQVAIRALYNSHLPKPSFRLSLTPTWTGTRAHVGGDWMGDTLLYKPREVRHLLAELAAIAPGQITPRFRDPPLPLWTVATRRGAFHLHADTPRHALIVVASTHHAYLAKSGTRCTVSGRGGRTHTLSIQP